MNVLRSIWAILTPGERRTAAGLVVLMLLGTLLETASIGLVVPALAVLTGDPLAVPAFLRPLASRFASDTTPRTILLMMAGLVVAYAFKSLFLLGATYASARFARGVQTAVSRRLFGVFLAQPWTFYLGRNSTALVHVMSEAQNLAMLVGSVIQVLSESLVVLGLFGLLFVMEPFGATVAAGTVGAAFLCFNLLVRPRVVAWSSVRFHHGRMLSMRLADAFGAAKEVKIRGCEREFLDRVSEHLDGLARMATRQSVVEQMPRAWFELLAVVALFLLTAALVWEGRPIRELVPLLGLFATVAFRVLPGVSFAAITLQRIHQFEPQLGTIRTYLALETPTTHGPPSPPRAFRDGIRLEGVGYRYPGGEAAVLDGVDLVIPHGAAIGVIGGSGAGKTTLIDVLLGLLPPSAGRVTVDGTDIRDDLRGWQQIVGYVPQSVFISDDSIRRNVAFGVPDAAIDDAAVRRALAAARLDDFVTGLPRDVETTVGERGVRLSGGQRQRIGIARALYHNPEVLVLDEATSALDTDTEREVMAAVEALHGVKTLVIVAHRLSTLSGCDRLYRLEAGRVVQSGTYAEVVPA